MNAATPTPSFLGRYRLIKVLGQGAMGVVYEAEDTRLGRSVAIKTVLRSHLVDEATAADFSARFEREAQAAARLSHPHIVTVFDFGEQDDIAYIVMEFVRGRELGQLLQDAAAPPDLPESVRIMGELLAALDLAHRQGVVHRDVKPANVLIDDASGHVKLTDFGVARVSNTGQDRTTPGTMVGTPSYMSPEQILGLPVGSRTDLFAAGVILYQLLTGQRPFGGEGPFEVQRKIVQDPARPPSELKPGLPPAFDAIVARALAKQPEQRYESAAAFAADLERALTTLPTVQAPAPLDPEATVVRPAALPSPPPAPAPSRPARRSARALLLGAGMAGMALLLLFLWPAAHQTPERAQTMPPAASAAAPASQSPAPSPPAASAPAPIPASIPASIPTSVPAPASASTPLAAPLPPRTRTPAAPKTEPAPAGLASRCSDLLQRLQLGEALSPEQSNFFQTRCSR